jgi:hypothetical protein
MLVMYKTKEGNEAYQHNATVTRSLPPILIPASGKDSDGRATTYAQAGLQQEVPADLKGKKFFGEWGVEDIWRCRSLPVKRFEPSFLDKKEDKDHLRGLVLLRSANEEQNPIASKTALEQASRLLIAEPKIRAAFRNRLPRDAAAMFYPAFFSREVKFATIAMWRTRAGQFLPAIFCPNARVASFVAAAFRGLAVCPHCSTLFDPEAPRMDGSRGSRYCKAVCGSRHRQKLYRLKVKSQAKKISKRKEKR